MVEVDVQLLVGAAVTVFLALMFFGVVVLWDVALALRSVGDKIDKLEDNIDDDLMDIGHALDGISSAPGGGGTQLHLSGGTISSGPEPAQAARAQAQAQTQPRQAVGADEDGPNPQSQQSQQPQQTQPSQGGAASVDQSEPSATVETVEGDAGRGAESPGDEREVDDAAETTEAEPTPESAEPEADAEPSHPRARINRNRFVTSPDRTAWYATALDRESIHAAKPSIAGELTDGTEEIDEAEIIAVGPAGATETEEPSESEPTDGPVAGDAATTESVAEADPAPVTGETDGPSADADDDTDESSTTGAGDVFTFEEEATGESNGSDDDRDAVADGQARSAETGLEPVDDTEDAADDDERATALESIGDGDENAVEPVDDARATDEAPTVDGIEPDAAAEVDRSSFGDVAAFEFDDDLEDAELTVEEAVDTINEDAPAPELSSHEFDVTAEIHSSEGGDDGDGDGAVLVFEFDTDTVDISGSTKRLLQYQMRSFADRESPPDGDVTIGRDRIVIEIADTEGDAVKRWGEAAVSIIDRTLYLSDNSSGSADD